MATTSNNRKNTSLVRSCKSRACDRTREAFRPKDCNPYAFLNEPIKEIAFSDIASDYIFGGAISWESNLQYIEASARKWCELHNKPFNAVPSSNPLTMITNIYTMLCQHTDDYRFDLDLDAKEKMLKIIEYRYCRFPDYTIFYIPAKCINDFESEDMRELVLRFYSYLYHETLFLLPEQSFDFSMLLDVPYEDAEDEYGKEMAKLVKCYRTGEAKALFDEIHNVPAPNRTDKAIRSFIKNLSDSDKKHHIQLIECIEKGLTLIMKDDLRNHSYFEGYCSDERFDARWEGDSILPERMFVICYGTLDDDELASTACQAFSEEANNMDVMYFRDGRHLSPNDTEIFEPSPYPGEWADWFGNLMDLLVI